MHQKTSVEDVIPYYFLRDDEIGKPGSPGA